MDMYYALTKYHLLSVIIHKMVYNDQPSTLYISDILPDSKELSNRILNKKIFDAVIIFPDKAILNERKKYFNLDNTEQIIQKNTELIIKYCGDILKYENYYICADHFPLGIYLNSVSKLYSYFEDGNGQQSKVESTIESSIKINDPVLYSIVNNMQLFGRNENVKTRYVDLSSQLEGYKDEKSFDFCIADIIKNILNKKQAANLKNIFEVYADDINSSGSVIFLPQHNVNLGVFNEQQQLSQTSILLDYFAEGKNIYIKPHPSDFFTNYSVLNNINIIEKNFPVELLSLVVKEKFDKAITAWSTSINSLTKIVKQKVYFTSEIDRKYNDIHKYFSALKILEYISENCTVINIFLFGADYDIVNNLVRYCEDIKLCKFNYYIISSENLNAEQWNKINKNELNICIVDEFVPELTQKVNSYTTLFMNSDIDATFFINSNNSAVFLAENDISIFDNILVVDIKILNLETNLYKENYDERIFVYMNDKEKRNEINNCEYIKRLPVSRQLLEINSSKESIDGNEAKQIYRDMKMLKGILVSTEQRVVYETKKNSELLMLIDEMNTKLREQESVIKNYEEQINNFMDSEKDITYLRQKISEIIESSNGQISSLEAEIQPIEIALEKLLKISELKEKLERLKEGFSDCK